MGDVHLHWEVPVELSDAERAVAKDLHRIGKLFVFLREVRHELFDEEFERRLSVAYKKPRGTRALAPGMLAMVTLLQAYTGTGDAEAVVTAKMDKRWQLVLGTLDSGNAPFSQGVLVDFRQRMLEHDLDRELLDRTVELAKRTGKFGWQKLKAALDSSPLLGAGRVEDTWNLIGRALSMVVDCAAQVTDLSRREVVQRAKLTLLDGPSLKASLNIDWDDREQRQQALDRLLGEVESLQNWIRTHAGRHAQKPPLSESLALLHRVLEQDLDPEPPSTGRGIRRGVAPDRMPSLGDREMRHGRKSRSKPFTGFKRHFVKLVEPNFIVGAVVLPANVAEHEALDMLCHDAERQAQVNEYLMDRGYLGSPLIGSLRERAQIRCKPWPLHNGGRFTKSDFKIDLRRRAVTCPANVSVAIREKSGIAQFPASRCSDCSLREQCTTARPTRGRSLKIHPQEELLLHLRQVAASNDGRKALRERTTIEHSLARVRWLQGTRARYKGARKNTLDARRVAAVINLQRLAKLQSAA